MGLPQPSPTSSQRGPSRRADTLLILLGLGGGVLLLGFGLRDGQTLLTAAGLFLLLLNVLWIALQGRTTQRVEGQAGQQARERLVQLSGARPIDKVASVDLGRHDLAGIVSRHLTSGRLFIVDVFNPGLAPQAPPARTASRTTPTAGDPRIVWYNGSVDLLPLPDRSVRAVFLDQVLSQLEQEGDRQALLREVARVLEPNGRLLLAEPVDSWPMRVAALTSGARPQSRAYWVKLLGGAELEVTHTEEVAGLLLCLGADKVSRYAGRQLALDLG